jgi:hypothetical protein
MKHNPAVGATDELSLRLSIATLVRVVFEHPVTGEWMLALERKATLRKAEHEHIVEVKSQPFGGAIRILDVDVIYDLIGDFHFDSEHSRDKLDFRLFIRPSSWSVLREFCIQHLSRVDDPILETNPSRELIEEFIDTLKISLKPQQFSYKPIATVVEDAAPPTENIHATGIPTVRVYRIFEALIVESSLRQSMLTNSEGILHNDLCELALDDFQRGGKGRANSVLTLPLRQITEAYRAMSPTERNAPILFGRHYLGETVSVILDEVDAPKYQRLK